MPVIRVGVQAPQGSPGQVVDLDAAPSATVSTITNASAESIAYSLNGGGTWVTLTAGAIAVVGGTVAAGQLRMRKVASAGAAPATVDVDAAAYDLAAALQAIGAIDGMLLPDSSPILFQGDRGIPYIVSGLALPASGTIGVASITAGVAYVGGMRRAIAGQVLTLTASRDNYVDVNQQGQLVISTVTLGAAAPALAVDSLRLGKVATDATSVTSRQITGADSLGNWMGNYVSVPYCRHVFSPSTVYTAGDRALAFGTSSTSYDNVNMHSESTQNTRFTVPTSGLYYVVGVIILASGATSSQWNAKIFKNGSSASLGTMSADAATVLTQRAGGIVEAAAGDFFELFLTNSVSVTQAAAAMQVARIA